MATAFGSAAKYPAACCRVIYSVRTLPSPVDSLRTQLQAERLQAALNRLESEERKVLEQDYVTQLKQSQGLEVSLILGLYRKSGTNSPIMKSHFRTFARARLLKEKGLDES